MLRIDYLIGGVNFRELSVIIKEAVGDKPAVTLNYGNFIQVVIDFLIIAFVIFMMVKLMNAAKKKQEEKPAAPPEPTRDQELLTEIRDLLKNK